MQMHYGKPKEHTIDFIAVMELPTAQADGSHILFSGPYTRRSTGFPQHRWKTSEPVAWLDLARDYAAPERSGVNPAWGQSLIVVLTARQTPDGSAPFLLTTTKRRHTIPPARPLSGTGADPVPPDRGGHTNCLPVRFLKAKE